MFLWLFDQNCPRTRDEVLALTAFVAAGAVPGTEKVLDNIWMKSEYMHELDHMTKW